MDTNPNESVFKQALEAALRERIDVRTEMETLSERLDVLKALDANLSQTVTALTAILGPRVDEDVVDEGDLDEEPSEDVARDEEPTRVAPPPSPPQEEEDDEREGESHEDYGPPLPQPRTLTRRVAPDSSPYRVGIILRSAQRPMPRDAIIHEYLGRGWADPKWTGDPSNNISQAIRRAVKYGWARPLPGERNVFVTTQTPDGRPVVGDTPIFEEAWS